jgi:hypothetical protein
VSEETGVLKASTISLRQAIIVALEELSGSLTLVGYQVTVSHIRTALDSQLQIASSDRNRGLGRHTNRLGRGGPRWFVYPVCRERVHGNQVGQEEHSWVLTVIG